MDDYLAMTETLLDLSRSMVEAAQAEAWDQVREQELRRQDLLRRLHASGAARGGDAGEILDEARCRIMEMSARKKAAANLTEIAALNARLVTLGVRATAELNKSISLLQRGRTANRAYHGLK